MKFKIGLLVLLFVSTGIHSQSNQSEKKAKEILNGVSAKYKSYKSLKATFNISSESSRDKKKTVRAGTLFLKGLAYKLEIEGQDIISDGKTRWTYVKDANEVQIDNLRTDENSITPANVFTMYEKGWHSKFIGELQEGGKTFQQIELIPQEPKKKNVFKVKLKIDKVNRFIASAEIFDKNGSTQLISVEKFIPDAVTDESIFTFSASRYPGAEVIDLR